MAIATEVMLRVERIFFLRKFAAPFIFFIAATLIIVSTVSVQHVVANMPAVFDVGALIKFFASAFAHTQSVVQFALVAGFAFLLWTLKGLIDSVRFVTLAKA
jgi:hypothetical protein